MAGVHLYEASEIVQFLESKCGWQLPGAGGRGSSELLTNRREVSIRQDE